MRNIGWVFYHKNNIRKINHLNKINLSNNEITSNL